MSSLARPAGIGCTSSGRKTKAWSKLYHLRKRCPKAGSDLLDAHLKQIAILIDEVVEVFPGHAPFTGRDKGDYHVHAASILRVTKEQFEYWGNKPGSQPLDKALIAAGCPQFAARVRENLRKIALM